MAATIRFGPYEVDAAGVEVRKHRIRIRLQEQPFRMLFALSTNFDGAINGWNLPTRQEDIWSMQFD